MCSVAELVAYLNTMPQEAIVECLVEREGSYSIYTSRTPVDLNNTDVIDLRNNPLVKKDSDGYGKIFIQLNGED